MIVSRTILWRPRLLIAKTRRLSVSLHKLRCHASRLYTTDVPTEGKNLYNSEDGLSKETNNSHHNEGGPLTKVNGPHTSQDTLSTKSNGVHTSKDDSSKENKTKKRSALFISPVWSEPSSSAAGVRTSFLIKTLQSKNWDVSYLRCFAGITFTFIVLKDSNNNITKFNQKFGLTLLEVHYIQQALNIWQTMFAESRSPVVWIFNT